MALSHGDGASLGGPTMLWWHTRHPGRHQRLAVPWVRGQCLLPAGRRSPGSPSHDKSLPPNSAWAGVVTTWTRGLTADGVGLISCRARRLLVLLKTTL